MATNWNCDGNGPHLAGEVRLYPTGNEPLHGNLILCQTCWAAENRYRFSRGKEAGRPEAWPQHVWNEAEVYGNPAIM